MQEVLEALGPGSRVLDLGCAGGSFESFNRDVTAVRVDFEMQDRPPANFVQADAARLPFAARSFDAIISNHSLEHIENLAGALEEIRRVIKPEGLLYIAVPDAATFSDRLYRWLARGGGHVNAFTSAGDLAMRIEGATGLKHAATRTLFMSLSFLHRGNRRARAPRKIWLIGGGTPVSLLAINFSSRTIDRILGSRLSVYGWAFYFGRYPEPIDCGIRSNVCIRCGSGHASKWLVQNHLVGARRLLRRYRCPNCGSMNLFTEDDRFQTAC